VSPECENVIHEFETYRFALKRPNNNEFEKPIKENDHAMDAIKYVISTYSPYFDEEEDREDFNMYGEDFM